MPKHEDDLTEEDKKILDELSGDDDITPDDNEQVPDEFDEEEICKE